VTGGLPAPPSLAMIDIELWLPWRPKTDVDHDRGALIGVA